MKTGSFEHLEQYCTARGIVCQRVGRTIELTTPDGGTTAEEPTLAEAWSTVQGDTTFSTLPVRPKPAPQPVRQGPELYRYSFYMANGPRASADMTASTLDEAAEKAGFTDFKRRIAFKGFGVLIHNPSGATIGVKWEPV